MKWEDNILECKVESDLKDILKTLVGFSNSVKPGHVAVLLIGKKNDGTTQGVTDPDSIQKNVRRECDKIYPPIVWRSTVYQKEGKNCVRVEVEYSGQTPHFGGPAWIRQGSETIKATDEIFQKLINIRSDIVFELSKWLNKLITVQGAQPVPERHNHRWELGERDATIVFVNNFWVTFELSNSGKVSEPIKKLTLSYDDKKRRLKVFIDY